MIRSADLPLQADVAASITAGTRVYRGWPVVVRGEGYTATLDVLAVDRGSRWPWYVQADIAPGIIDLRTRGARGVYVGSMAVSGADLASVLGAVAAAPDRMDRHDDLADSMRLEAGRIALRIRNTMIRARTLDAVDGWVAIEERGDLVDRSADGILIHPPEDMELACRLLLVTCPSTGRRYCLRVPAAIDTTHEARKWVNRGIVPEVET